MGGSDNEDDSFPVRLEASAPGEKDVFGYDVAVFGNTVVVGASAEDGHGQPQADPEDNSARDAGAAYAFQHKDGKWTQQAYLKPTYLDLFDGFGYSVAIHQDTIAVGSWKEASGKTDDPRDDSASYSGAVYIFTLQGDVWTQSAYVKAPQPGVSDLFGFSVAIWGDTLAVGAPEEDSSARGINGDLTDDSSIASGAVYVYQRNGTNWDFQAYLKASNTDPEDRMGTALSLYEDTLAVGSAGEDALFDGSFETPDDNNAPQSGATYVFERSAGTWAQQAYLKHTSSQAGDRFGSSVSVYEDLLAVGAPGRDTPLDTANSGYLPAVGTVVVFRRSAGIWNAEKGVFAPDGATDDAFGGSVDINARHLVVGAPGSDSGPLLSSGLPGGTTSRESGTVYVFQQEDGQFTFQRYLKAANPRPGDQLGSSVALDGNTVASGAFRADVPNGPADTFLDAGAVYLWADLDN
jgi:hypothetical protein